jgi:hypothetical protein
VFEPELDLLDRKAEDACNIGDTLGGGVGVFVKDGGEDTELVGRSARALGDANKVARLG